MPNNIEVSSIQDPEGDESQDAIRTISDDLGLSEREASLVDNGLELMDLLDLVDEELEVINGFDFDAPGSDDSLLEEEMLKRLDKIDGLNPTTYTEAEGLVSRASYRAYQQEMAIRVYFQGESFGNPESVFAKLFGREPVGEVELVRSAGVIGFVCSDLNDYVIPLPGAEKEGYKNSSGGYADPKTKKGFGFFMVKQQSPVRDEAVEHERRHVQQQWFADERVWEATDDAIQNMYQFSNEGNLDWYIKNSYLTILDKIETRASIEILAQIRGGKDPLFAFAYIFAHENVLLISEEEAYYRFTTEPYVKKDKRSVEDVAISMAQYLDAWDDPEKFDQKLAEMYEKTVPQRYLRDLRRGAAGLTALFDRPELEGREAELSLMFEFIPLKHWMNYSKMIIRGLNSLDLTENELLQNASGMNRTKPFVRNYTNEEIVAYGCLDRVGRTVKRVLESEAVVTGLHTHMEDAFHKALEIQEQEIAKELEKKATKKRLSTN